ncbi:beta-lactamase/transpeptidase-like protein [Bisporella sp. PMI_857]|nr:beta-lactamase/transpeptidase-like protein [Bisporella sp. PMI_857]
MTVHHHRLTALKSTRGDIEKICQVSGVPSVSVVVISHGETIFTENIGYSNIAKQTMMTSDTIFQIASMTKSFTATCINRLRVEGKLKLDDTIRNIIPGARSRDLIVAQFATIADLLGHRTALQRANDWWQGAAGELLLKGSKPPQSSTNCVLSKAFDLNSCITTFVMLC